MLRFRLISSFSLNLSVYLIICNYFRKYLSQIFDSYSIFFFFFFGAEMIVYFIIYIESCCIMRKRKKRHSSNQIIMFEFLKLKFSWHLKIFNIELVVIRACILSIHENVLNSFSQALCLFFVSTFLVTLAYWCQIFFFNSLS